MTLEYRETSAPMSDYKPKLIEVALPLDAINKAAAREKSIRHGHPSTLHQWWSRKPLVACRAVLWASLVDDPSAHPGRFPTEEDRAVERKRLFGILERLVIRENSNNLDVLNEARKEIEHCFEGELPVVLDPFAGGGSIPLEAQRLGLKVLAGDLNPVAVMINKAMVEIPHRFADKPPVHPDVAKDLCTWSGAQGLAADIKAYGTWMRDEAERRIGHLYPDATDPDGDKLTPIAWIWARTVRSPDPAWDGHVPLVTSWILRKEKIRKTKKNRSEVWVEPVIDPSSKAVSYKVNYGFGGGGGGGGDSYKPTVTRGNGICIATGATIPVEYIRSEGLAGRMGAHLLAVVAEGNRGRRYCEPLATDLNACQKATKVAELGWKPSGSMPPRGKGLGFSVQNYGLSEWWQLFTDRQLLALTTFSDLLRKVHNRICEHAKVAGLADDQIRLRNGGSSAVAYADAVVTYLAFAIDKMAGLCNTLCPWEPDAQCPRHLFSKQSIGIMWDFAEGNPLGSSSGSWRVTLDGIVRTFDSNVWPTPAGSIANVSQVDARTFLSRVSSVVVSTDPPYYDNIGYADISDFFYVWLRSNLAEIWPVETGTLLSPKAEELIADPKRQGSKQEAKEHFENGMAEFMAEVARTQRSDAPATVYYAYKATESSEGGFRSTGWDTFLQAIANAGLQITATWPLQTEASNRMRARGSNVLASSVVLACRPRSDLARSTTRGDFVSALQAELPDAISLLQSGIIAPADLPQSTIGPGIKVFSRYTKVVQADGSSMSVSDALVIINEVLDDVLHGEESELDSDTRFALAWYAQHGFESGPFGAADSIARAKNTSVEGVARAGVGEASGGKFRLYRRSELDYEWDPDSDARLTAWEALQHLVARLEKSESGAAELLSRLKSRGDSALQLAYLLYKTADDNGWNEEASVYNGLAATWTHLRAIAPKMIEDELLK